MNLFQQELLNVALESSIGLFKENQKDCEKEILIISKTIKELYKKTSTSNQADIVKLKTIILNLKVKLQTLIKSLNENREKEQNVLNNLQKRLIFMQQLETHQPIFDEIVKEENRIGISSQEEEEEEDKEENQTEKQKKELSLKHKKDQEYIMIITYLLRHGNINTAKYLANKYNLNHLVDIDEFEKVHFIMKNLLLNKNEYALKWCALNKTKAKKFNSQLEFNLRLLEMFNTENSLKAIEYAQKYLAPNCETDKQKLKALKNALTTIAFQSLQTTTNNNHKKRKLDSEDETETTSDQKINYNLLNLQDFLQPLQIANQFYQESEALLNLQPHRSAFEVLLLLGLSTLKSRFCDHEIIAPSCPTCYSLYATKLTDNIPYSHKSQSKLICRLTGEIMAEPVCLPNGQVYSRKILATMALESNSKEEVTINGETFKTKDFKTVFLT